MDSPKARRAPLDERHIPPPPTALALIWINAVLLVPAIFGIMFLPPLIRLLVISLGAGLVATYGILFAWARVHPASAGAHLLQTLHLKPRRRVTR